MASAHLDLPARMSLWRRRVVGTGLGIFAGSWLAVFGLGQHAHARTSSGSAAPSQQSTSPGPAQDASGGAYSDGGDGSYGGYYDDGGGYADGGGYGSNGGSQDPYAGQGSAGSQSQQSQPPLVTRQS